MDLNLLEQARTRLTDALGGDLNGLMALDQDLNIVQIDAAAADALNIDLSESLGKPVKKAIGKKKLPHLKDALANPGKVFEGNPTKKFQRAIVTLTVDDTIWIAVRDTKPTQQKPVESTQANFNEDAVSDLLHDLAEARDLTELTHALVAWMRQHAPASQGSLSIPYQGALVHVAQWPSKTWTAPVHLDEVQAVRQGRIIVTDQTEAESDTKSEVSVVPVYRGLNLMCVLTGDAPTELLESIGYTCGVRIEQFSTKD